MPETSIPRRQFLQSGLMAASLVTAGHLPLLARESVNGSGIDGRSGPYAIKPVRGYVRRFSPATREGKSEVAGRLTYDVIHWPATVREAATSGGTVVGEVSVMHEVKGDSVWYEIKQRKHIGGVDNFVEATVTCNADIFHSVREWQLKSYERDLRGGVDPLSRLTETGRRDDGRIRVQGGRYRYEHAAENPVITQWHVPGLLMRPAEAGAPRRFDLLQDLSLFKPDHVLSYDGKTEVRLSRGRTIHLETYAQTGQGILPIHYLLDAQRRPQLITSSIVSWALKE
ncbi:MAG: hypothetical protein ACYTAS_03020 [Planctomycetota bacterium]|jgi:hypothetical protein